MTATDELRRLLDERGVEWSDDGYPTTCTVWASDGIVWYGLWRDGCIELIAWRVTPEQAIEATLGRGTCRRVFIQDWLWRCSECGSQHDTGHLFNYCPNCGRKVAEP